MDAPLSAGTMGDQVTVIYEAVGEAMAHDLNGAEIGFLIEQRLTEAGFKIVPMTDEYGGGHDA